jgi:hypothetical protein
MRPAERSRKCGHGRAVSPVTGIVLLIAIGVVIASVLGVVAVQLVTGETQPPKATVFVGSCETADGNTVLKLQHNGGDVVDVDRLQLRYRDVGWRYVPERGPKDAITGSVRGTVEMEGDSLAPGDTILFGHTLADLRFSGSTVELVWEDGESGYVLAGWRGSDGGFGTSRNPHCPFPPAPGSSVHAYNVSMGECELTPGSDDRGHGNQCTIDEDPDNPGGGNDGGAGGNGGGGGGNGAGN